MSSSKGVLAGTFVAFALLGAATASAGSVGEAPAPTAAVCATATGKGCAPIRAGSCATATGFASAAGGLAARLAQACPSAPAPVAQGPDRYGYCSVAGNVSADGRPLEPGSFLNLYLGQPDGDAHYTGATPAYFVRGVGVTCSLTTTQAALIAASAAKVNHTGGTGDVNLPELYVLVG